MKKAMLKVLDVELDDTEDRRTRSLCVQPGVLLNAHVTDATEPLTIKGTLGDAIQGKPGQPMACHLATALCSKRNAKAFPGGVSPLFVVVLPSTLHVVTSRSSDGVCNVLRYHHSHGRFVNLNDSIQGREWAHKNHPEWFTRDFTFQPPRQPIPRKAVKKQQKPRAPGRKKQKFYSTGTMGRAVRAGLVSARLETILGK
jgi:hypothetical protein